MIGIGVCVGSSFNLLLLFAESVPRLVGDGGQQRS